MAHSKHPAMSDENLIAAARTGNTDAYAELWTRHSAAALRAARQFTTVAEADDLVAEAYLRILVALRDGGGPTGAFRPYLFVTIRNLAIHIARAPRNDTVEDFDQIVDQKSNTDPSIVALDRSLTVRAYRSLPESWQTVLWYTEVEGMRPREVAPLLGMSANTVAALAYRARDALRTAWIQAHVNDEGTSQECKWLLERVGKYARGHLPDREQARADRHIDSCARCIIVVEEADDIGSRLALVLLPMVLGAGAGTAYRLFGQDQVTQAVASQAGVGIGTQLAVAAGAVLLVGSAVVGGISTITANESAGPRVTAPIASPGEDAPLEEPAEDLPIAVTPSPSATPVPPLVVDDPPEESRPDPAPDPAPDPPTPQPDPVPDPVPDPEPDPEPEPVPDPDPPTDTEALPPVVSTVLSDDMIERPALEGTAEPLSSVTVADDTGAILATVTTDATGAWSTGPLVALTPAATGLSVVQLDQAGNTSTATELGPFAFHPTIVALPDDFIATPGVPFDVEAFGWPGAAVVFAIDGDGGFDSVEKVFDETGRSHATVTFGSSGSLIFSARYVGADQSTTQSFPITAS